MQFVLFPYLVTVELALPAPLVGAAQMCTMLPSLLFPLPAGVLADQTDGRRATLLYHRAAALPPLGLAAAIGLDTLSFKVLIGYALAMETLIAFIVPIRDSPLTHLAPPARLQQPIGIAVMLQFGVQVVGMAVAGSAKWVGAEPLGAVTLGFAAAALGPYLAALGPYLAALVPALLMACVLAYLVTQTRLRHLRSGAEA